jgi:hypothetical protein
MADDQDDRSEGGGLRKQLEDALAEAKRAKAELEQVRAEKARDEAFAKAGIPDSPTGKLFRKAYDGAPDAEAIRAAAQEYGVLEPPAPTTPPAEREQLISLQNDQPFQQPQSKGRLDDLAKQIASMDGTTETNEQIMDLLRQHGLTA